MLRLSHKILLIFVLQLTAAFAVLMYSHAHIAELRQQAQSAIDINLRHKNYVNDLENHFGLYFGTLESSLAQIDLRKLYEKRDALAIYALRLDDILSMSETEPFTRFSGLAATLRTHLTLLDSEADEIFGYMQIFAQMNAYNAFDRNVVPLKIDVQSLIAQNEQLVDEALAVREADMETIVERARLSIYVAMGMLTFASIILALILWRSTLTPISDLTDFIRSRKEQKLRADTIPFVGRKDEIGEFSQSFRELMQQNEAFEIEVQAQARDLLLAKEEAEKASQAKSDFLANMSHELRTPLNSMMGMLQLINPKDVSKQALDMIKVVTISSKALLDTVNDILDLSKIEAREVRLEYLAFDVDDKVQNLVQVMQPMASKNNLTLTYNGLKDPVYVLGDPLRFVRILTNLIGNAVRYTQEGEVTLRLSVEKIFADQIMLHCEVSDTGIGIAKDRQETIFDKFSQADISTTRKFGGTGLGLTITKELVEMMDGVIGVESTLGEGSTFWFQIPFEVIGELPEQPKKTANISVENDMDQVALPPQALNILVAEDHEMNQLFMKRLFTNLGFESYTIAENGKECLQELENGFFDLILMDCHMPEMNGYDATIAIRELDDEDKSNIPIIAMTANAMPEDAERCLEIGMNAYISKPVDIDVFKNTLAPWVDFESSDLEDLLNSSHGDEVNTMADINLHSDQTDQGSPVDLTLLKANSMGDDDFVKEMIRLFVQETEEKISQLKALQKDKDEIHEWIEVSHALKGSAGGVGAEEMRRLCEIAQKLDTYDEGRRAELITGIESQYQSAKSYLIEQGYYKVA